jgi:hypothetical protein
MRVWDRFAHVHAWLPFAAAARASAHSRASVDSLSFFSIGTGRDGDSVRERRRGEFVVGTDASMRRCSKMDHSLRAGRNAPGTAGTNGFAPEAASTAAEPSLLHPAHAVGPKFQYRCPVATVQSGAEIRFRAERVAQLAAVLHRRRGGVEVLRDDLIRRGGAPTDPVDCTSNGGRANVSRHSYVRFCCV